MRKIRCRSETSVRGRVATALPRRALPHGLEQQHRGRGGDVERVDPPAGAGSRRAGRSVSATRRRRPFPSLAEDEHHLARSGRRSVYGVSAPGLGARRSRRPASLARPSQSARFRTRAIGRCSTAPAEALQAAAVTAAERRVGITTPAAPAASAERQTAPRLRGSWTWSSATTSASGRSSSAPRVGVGIGVDLGDDPLVVGRARPAASSSPGGRSSRRPDPAHAPPAALRLGDRAPAVDDLAAVALTRHELSRRRRTSRAPSGVSRTSQPELGELVADLVGPLEVARRPRLLALGEQPLGLRIGRLGRRRAAIRARAAPASPPAPRGRPASVAPVPLGDQLEERRQRPRRVEVVGERVEEGLAPGRHERVRLAGRRASGSSRTKFRIRSTRAAASLERLAPRTRAAGGSARRSGRRPPPRGP